MNMLRRAKQLPLIKLMFNLHPLLQASSAVGLLSYRTHSNNRHFNRLNPTFFQRNIIFTVIVSVDLLLHGAFLSS